MNVLQYGVMLECKNVFAFGIFLRIKETSSHQLEKGWLITQQWFKGFGSHCASRSSGDTFDTEAQLSSIALVSVSPTQRVVKVSECHQKTSRTAVQCYLYQFNHWGTAFAVTTYLLISTTRWAPKRIFLVPPDSGRCSNDHCAYNIL